MKAIKIMLAASIAINIIAIPYLCWKLLGLNLMYSTNVNYCSSFAYAVGYFKGRGDDLEKALKEFPTRLDKIKAGPNSVEVRIWPAKEEYLLINFEGGPNNTYCLISEKAN